MLDSQKFKDLFGQRLYRYVCAWESLMAFSSRVNFLYYKTVWVLSKSHLGFPHFECYPEE